MSKIFSPKIVTDGLVVCLDPSQNKSYPTDLPIKDGLVMWMDAADDTTFSYSSGTTVSQWRDKSGFNYHMVPVSAGPTRNAFLNSRKVLAFTTSQDIQNLSIDLRTSPYTVFIVSRYTSPSAGTGRILTSNGGYNNWLLGHWASETNKYYANGWVYQTYAAIDTNWKLYLGDWGGSSNNIAAFYTAGTSLITNSANVGAGPWTLGINANASERSNCEAAEIIVFNRLLSTAERRLVHTYLGQKWGISNTDRSIIDLSGNNNHGLLGNGTVANMPVADYYNKNTLRFDGVNDYVFVNNPGTFSSYTFMFFCRWISNTLNGSRIFGVDNFGTFTIFTPSNVAFHYNQAAGTTTVLSSGANVGLDTWCHVAVSVSPSFTKIYINGAYLNGTSTGPYVSVAGNFFIGAQYTTNVLSNSNVGPFQFYSRVLSDAEIVQNYEAQKSKFVNTIVQQGLVLNLDAGNPYSYAGAGTTWFDVSGNGYNGTLTSSPVYSTDSGGAFKFSGNYSLSPASTVNSLNGDALTVEAWIKHDSFGGVGTGRGYVSNWSSFNVNNQRGFILRTYDTQTFPSFWWCWGGGNNYWAEGPSNYVMQTGKIYHIVATYEKNVAMKIYINGNLELTTTNYTSNTILFDTSNGTHIGYSPINTSYMDGNIYSARLYNRVLTAAQVLQNYNATKGRFGL